MSNSTAPAYQTGDIVILDKTLPFKDYHVGDAVLYSPPDFPEIIIHKIYDIQIINGTYYFAIKGDANPQPDTVAQTGNITNELLTNRTVTWSTFYGSNTTNPIANYTVASYYPANQVVYGKVIYKIPALGWFFVPFNSPLPEPFHILPISMFSVFVIFYIILVIISFFGLMNNANSELRKLLRNITAAPMLHISPSRIKINRYYSYIIYPFIIFAFLFFTATPSPLVDTTTIALQSSTQNQIGNFSYTQLTYTKAETLHSSYSISQNNVTQIYLSFYNQSSTIYLNITKDMKFVGQNLQSAEAYNITKTQSYKLVIDAKAMFVNSSSIPNVPELGRFFDYFIPIQKSNPVGIMTDNVFLEANTGTYNNTPCYTTHLDFSFIQDLISFHWKVNAHFMQSSGYLQYMQVIVTQQLWGIPEYVGLFVIALGSAVIYTILRAEFQKLYDEKYHALTKEQFEKNNQSLPPATEPIKSLFDTPPVQNNSTTDVSHNSPEEATGTEPDPNSVNDKKKLTWEDWKKLEDGD